MGHMESTFSDNPKKLGRRHMDGESSDIPWWIRAVVYMGVPAAIACYLVYILAQTVTASQAQVQSTLNTLVLSVASMQTEHTQIKMVNEAMLRVLQVTCANQAENADARERCLR